MELTQLLKRGSKFRVYLEQTDLKYFISRVALKNDNNESFFKFALKIANELIKFNLKGGWKQFQCFQVFLSQLLK